MISSTYLFCLVLFLVEPIDSSAYRRFRRQINPVQNKGLGYQPQPAQGRISGSIGGTAYYGINSDPNHGAYIARPNRPGGGGFQQISYDQNSPQFQYLIKPSHLHQSQQVNYPYAAMHNNIWQRPNRDNYKYHLYQGYLPANGGWYASGNQLTTQQRWDENRNSFWYNRGQSILGHSSLTLITLAIVIVCK